ncbi:hypothetical protein NDA17_004071 [Ustilago hordei]|nr:hypothetical protein NDA17_004071 [Ustilago hordei]
MTDPDLNNKLDRLLTLLEAQLELTRQVSFNLDEQEDINYEKYASPTGPRYVKTKLDPYSRTRTDPYPLDHEEDTSIMAELNRSKPIATPFPKFNPRDMEIFILEAEAWFKFNQVYEQSRMINHMGAQLEGTAREWWTSKLRIDRAREGRLFNDWHYFTERLSEQFNPRNARMEAYNKLLALRLTSDAPGAATRHVERFRDLEGQVNLDDNELVIDLFRARSPSQATTQATIQNLNRPLPHHPTQPSKQGSPAPSGINTCHVCKGIGHWARDCPSRRVNPLSSRPMGPKVMVTTADPFEEATDSGDGHTGSTETGDPEAMDLSSYQQPMDPDHEEEHDDDDNKGNVSKAVLELSGMVQDHPARILADTGAGLSIVSDSFINVFDEVEADKLPHHTEHDLHLELIEGVLFVPKKDGGLRLCVDYRGLNEITVKNRAPLPLIEEQLFLLRKARIYTKLDLRAAYNLIRIAKGDEWKTAFGTQLGLYEYLVMPFGLANAPAHFQSFINDIFRDIIGVYVVVYLDDFLIFSDTEEVHVKHVTEVLTRLRNNRLFAKLSKCEFHTKTVEFLGYIIKPTGIEMDPEKVRTVKEWPMPESIHDIQRFLGFANFYRRFIAHFARIAKPLTALVKPIERFKKFELPEEAQQAFHKLIQAFTSAGVLQHFDYHLPTRLETDASDFAIAGVLKQEHEGRWHPVAFYSRKMSPAEKNYEIHDKELLAVVACLTQWRHMLAGLPNQLVILTDHEALKYFKSQRRITGDKGGEPDALTRRTDMQPAGEEQDHNVRQLLPPRVFKETADHDSLLVAPMISMESIASKGLKDLVKIFQPLDQELQEIHRKKPFEVRDDLWYSGGRPWGSISLDFIEGLPTSKKYDSKTYDSILVIVDRLTKFAILAPTHKTVTAKQTAVLLYGHMVRLFGYPDHMTERVNQVIEQYLRMYCNYEQNDWANLLDTAAFVYNNTVHNSIGVSPFFACYGWNPKAHPDIPQRLGVNDPGRFEYLMDGKERCKYLQEQIREAQRRSVDQYNRKHKDIEFKVGDMVYINRRNWKTRRPTPKLDTRFAGPYPVQEWVGRRAYRITLPANLRVHDVFHVSMLEPARTSSLPQRAEQPTMPPLPDEDLDFEVEALIDKRSHNGTTEYKVLWRGYSEEAASWEPVENLNCPDLIQEYEVSEGGRVSRQSRERRREQEE